MSVLGRCRQARVREESDEVMNSEGRGGATKLSEQQYLLLFPMLWLDKVLLNPPKSRRVHAEVVVHQSNSISYVAGACQNQTMDSKYKISLESGYKVGT
jgi:hypothetical protein